MTALIGFVRELGLELLRRADTIDAEARADPAIADPKNAADHDVMVVAVAASTVLRHIGSAIAAAAKKTFLA